MHLVYALAPSDLKQHMAAEPNRTLAIGQIRDCLRQLLGGLAHVHGAGLMHTDVKPANIFAQSPTPWMSVLGDLGSAVDVSGP